MAVLQTILNLFASADVSEPETVVPAPPTEYRIRPLTSDDIDEVLRLNMRCFRNGENYTRHTFAFLLNEPRAVSYQAATAEGDMAGFVVAMVNPDGAGHLTTIGVAPEHRRRGIADRMLKHLEETLRAKGVSTIMLEVRVGNTGAQDLYRRAGYNVVQRIAQYYNNGEDGYLMMKPIF